MKITFLGHASLLIETKGVKIVCDPFSSGDPELGLKFAKPEADIVTISHFHHDHADTREVKGNPFIVKGPGEYEIKGINIFGIETFHDAKRGQERGKNTIYLFESEDLTVCHLGDLGHKLDEDQEEELGDVDVLLIPVGGVYTLEPKEAAEFVRDFEPKIAIPMHFKVPGLKFELRELGEFLKEMGKGQIESQEKLEISKDKLPEETQIVVLKAKS